MFGQPLPGLEHLLGYLLMGFGSVTALAMLVIGPFRLWKDRRGALLSYVLFFVGIAAVKAGSMFIRPSTLEGWPTMGFYLLLAFIVWLLWRNQLRSEKNEERADRVLSVDD